MNDGEYGEYSFQGQIKLILPLSACLRCGMGFCLYWREYTHCCICENFTKHPCVGCQEEFTDRTKIVASLIEEDLRCLKCKSTDIIIKDGEYGNIYQHHCINCANAW